MKALVGIGLTTFIALLYVLTEVYGLPLLLGGLLSVSFVNCFIDLSYFFNLAFSNLRESWSRSQGSTSTKSLLDVTTYNTFVTSIDIDRNNHMNNARYLRQLNFARKSHLDAVGVWHLCNQRYSIESRIVGWDAKAFYLEQRFVTTDPVYFVHAVVHVKYNVVSLNKTSKVPLGVPQVLSKLPVKVKEIALPSSVLSWIKSMDESSLELRNEGESRKED